MGQNNRDEDLYKRDEDKEWRKTVDRERLLLTTAVNVLQEQARELKNGQREIDSILRGHSGHPGLIASYEKLDETMRRLYSVVWQDPTGQKGLLHDVDFLMGRKKAANESEKIRAETARARGGWFWAFITAVVVAVITGVLSNLDKIDPLIKKAETRLHPTRTAAAPKKKSGRWKVRRRVVIQQPAEQEPEPEPEPDPAPQ